MRGHVTRVGTYCGQIGGYVENGGNRIYTAGVLRAIVNAMTCVRRSELGCQLFEI